MTPVAQLDYAVNALGYSSAQGRLLGLVSRTGVVSWPRPGHLIGIDRNGGVVDLGAVDAPWHRLDDVTAGAVSGSRFFVRDNDKLHAIDIDPASASYLSIVQSVELSPEWLAESIDDFAVNPADGRLYGVSSAGHGPGKVVSLDPASGNVTKIAAVEGLPGGSTYGAVVVDSGGTMYAINNGFLHRSRIYRLPVNGSGPAVEIATGPPAAMIDAAGCLPGPVPPKPEPPTTVPQPNPVPPPARPVPPGAPVTTTPPVPPVPPVPPPGVVKPDPQPAPPKPVAMRNEPPRKPTAQELTATSMTKGRKWAIVTIILVLLGTAGAAARARP